MNFSVEKRMFCDYGSKINSLSAKAMFMGLDDPTVILDTLAIDLTIPKKDSFCVFDKNTIYVGYHLTNQSPAVRNFMYCNKVLVIKPKGYLVLSCNKGYSFTERDNKLYTIINGNFNNRPRNWSKELLKVTNYLIIK